MPSAFAQLCGKQTCERVIWDIETRSAVNLRECGAYIYAIDPTTQPLCLAFAIDDGRAAAVVADRSGAVRSPRDRRPLRRSGARSAQLQLSSSAAILEVSTDPAAWLCYADTDCPTPFR